MGIEEFRCRRHVAQNRLGSQALDCLLRENRSPGEVMGSRIDARTYHDEVGQCGERSRDEPCGDDSFDEQEPAVADTHTRPLAGAKGGPRRDLPDDVEGNPEGGDDDMITGGHVQNYGQIVRAGGKSFAPSPGIACRGNAEHEE